MRDPSRPTPDRLRGLCAKGQDRLSVGARVHSALLGRGSGKCRRSQIGVAPLSFAEIIDVNSFPFLKRQGQRTAPLLHYDNVLHLLTYYGFALSYNVITKDIEESHPTSRMQGGRCQGRLSFARKVALRAERHVIRWRRAAPHRHCTEERAQSRRSVLRPLEVGRDDTLDALVGALHIAANRATATRIILHRMLLQACAAADAGVRGMTANAARQAQVRVRADSGR